MPPLSHLSDNAGTALWTSLLFPQRCLCRPHGQSPPPPPPPPLPPLDAVREDRVRGYDIDDDCNGPSIAAVVLLGWLRKRTRRGTWVWRWFVLNLSGGGALLASSSSAAGVIVRVEAVIPTTTGEQGGCARWREGRM